MLPKRGYSVRDCQKLVVIEEFQTRGSVDEIELKTGVIVANEPRHQVLVSALRPSCWYTTHILVCKMKVV